MVVVSRKDISVPIPKFITLDYTLNLRPFPRESLDLWLKEADPNQDDATRYPEVVCLFFQFNVQCISCYKNLLM